jgi:hypothetical protein
MLLCHDDDLSEAPGRPTIVCVTCREPYPCQSLRIAAAVYSDHPRYLYECGDRTTRIRALTERHWSVCSSPSFGDEDSAVTPTHGGRDFRLSRCGYGTNQTYLTQPWRFVRACACHPEQSLPDTSHGGRAQRPAAVITDGRLRARRAAQGLH